MSSFLEKLQTEYENIAKTQIGRLEPGLSADEVVSACKKIVDDVRSHRVIVDELIKSHLYPMLENISDISDEDETILFETVQKISAYETRFDPGLAYEIYQSLLKRAREKKDPDKIVKYLYWCGITVFYFVREHSEKILSFFKEGASHSIRYRRIKDEEARRYVHRCLGNYHMMLFTVNKPEKAAEVEDDIFSFWNALLFSGIDPDFPWLTYFLTCLTHKYAYLATKVHSDPDSETKENLQKLLDSAIVANKLYHKNKELFSVHGGTRYDFMLWEAQFLCGLISFDQLRDNVYSKQETFADDDFSSDAIYVKINLFSFLMFYAANMRELRNIKDEFLAEALNKVIHYVTMIPKSANTREITRQLRSFAVDLSEVLEPLEQLNFVLKLTTYRNIPTYAHSIMTGKIAVCLTKFLVSKNPEYFIGCMDLATADDVKVNVYKLYEFAETCGLCHDIGKFSYADNPYMVARVLTEDELEIVRQHPEEGFSMFKQKKCALYSGYSDVILGHHKFYDNSGGYPESFNITESKHRKMVDIIKVADSIDAATDNVGKAYGTPKSLEDVCAEIRRGSGREYSPVLAELLDDAPVIPALKHVLDIERNEAYYTAYTHAWS